MNAATAAGFGLMGFLFALPFVIIGTFISAWLHKLGFTSILKFDKDKVPSLFKRFSICLLASGISVAIAGYISYLAIGHIVLAMVLFVLLVAAIFVSVSVVLTKLWCSVTYQESAKSFGFVFVLLLVTYILPGAYTMYSIGKAMPQDIQNLAQVGASNSQPSSNFAVVSAESNGPTEAEIRKILELAISNPKCSSLSITKFSKVNGISLANNLHQVDIAYTIHSKAIQVPKEPAEGNETTANTANQSEADRKMAEEIQNRMALVAYAAADCPLLLKMDDVSIESSKDFTESFKMIKSDNGWIVHQQ